MRRILNFIVGALVGGLIGAITALLFAPSSGSELRTQISDRAENIAADVRQAANGRRIELQERLDTLRSPKA